MLSFLSALLPLIGFIAYAYGVMETRRSANSEQSKKIEDGEISSAQNPEVSDENIYNIKYQPLLKFFTTQEITKLTPDIPIDFHSDSLVAKHTRLKNPIIPRGDRDTLRVWATGSRSGETNQLVRENSYLSDWKPETTKPN